MGKQLLFILRTTWNKHIHIVGENSGVLIFHVYDRKNVVGLWGLRVYNDTSTAPAYYALYPAMVSDTQELRIQTSSLPVYTGVPGGKVNILGGHSIGHSKQTFLYEHVSYSERFPR